jgi:hypothetical protein
MPGEVTGKPVAGQVRHLLQRVRRRVPSPARFSAALGSMVTRTG